jgi:hypothetical protein
MRRIYLLTRKFIFEWCEERSQWMMKLVRDGAD